MYLQLFILFTCGIALSTTSDSTAEVVNATIVTENVTPKQRVLDASKCKGKGYQFYQNTGCYKIHKETQTWDEANLKCTEDGAYLAIVNDETEAKELIRRFGRRMVSSSAWVGITDEEGYGAWRTVRGDNLDNLYRLWTNYSMNLTGGRSCGGLTKQNLLLQCACVDHLNPLCEKDV